MKKFMLVAVFIFCFGFQVSHGLKDSKIKWHDITTEVLSAKPQYTGLLAYSYVSFQGNEVVNVIYLSAFFLEVDYEVIPKYMGYVGTQHLLLSIRQQINKISIKIAGGSRKEIHSKEDWVRKDGVLYLKMTTTFLR